MLSELLMILVVAAGVFLAGAAAGFLAGLRIGRRGAQAGQASLFADGWAGGAAEAGGADGDFRPTRIMSYADAVEAGVLAPESPIEGPEAGRAGAAQSPAAAPASPAEATSPAPTAAQPPTAPAVTPPTVTAATLPAVVTRIRQPAPRRPVAARLRARLRGADGSATFASLAVAAIGGGADRLVHAWVDAEPACSEIPVERIEMALVLDGRCRVEDPWAWLEARAEASGEGPARGAGGLTMVRVA